MQILETEMLAEEENVANLVRVNRELLDKIASIDAQRRILLNNGPAGHAPVLVLTK